MKPVVKVFAVILASAILALADEAADHHFSTNAASSNSAAPY